MSLHAFPLCAECSPPPPTLPVSTNSLRCSSRATSSRKPSELVLLPAPCPSLGYLKTHLPPTPCHPSIKTLLTLCVSFLSVYTHTPFDCELPNSGDRLCLLSLDSYLALCRHSKCFCRLKVRMWTRNRRPQSLHSLCCHSIRALVLHRSCHHRLPQQREGLPASTAKESPNTTSETSLQRDLTSVEANSPFA